MSALCQHPPDPLSPAWTELGAAAGLGDAKGAKGIGQEGPGCPCAQQALIKCGLGSCCGHRKQLLQAPHQASCPHPFPGFPPWVHRTGSPARASTCSVTTSGTGKALSALAHFTRLLQPQSLPLPGGEGMSKVTGGGRAAL